ncbi:CPBP family intramembrane glutamic endopeptidase [Microbulbifer sp. SAOS-129_SWC]|uniref:CPBP family intramembrane glutamic endopeptidase n=1 Tax=Microbulbifer sp. SAOS-129_SWC TaxID=3145235 RepID=UPI0032177251
MAGLLPTHLRAKSTLPLFCTEVWLVAAALLLCAIPFGWTGLLAPFIWLTLCALENADGWRRGLVYLIAALLMSSAALGVLPGSERILLAPTYSDSSGNSIQAAINPGKAVIAIAMLVLLARSRYRPRCNDLPFIAAVILIPLSCAAAVFGLSAKFAPTIVPAAMVNLLVVCISEEGFFRWILQRALEEGFGRWRWCVPMAVTAIFTGLHTGWAASPVVLLLVSVAGFCYAGLWYLRRSFWACVLAHWGVNALHMFLLPYPLH